MLALMAGACRVGLIALRAKLIRDPEKKSAMHTKVGHFFENSGDGFSVVKTPSLSNESKTNQQRNPTIETAA